MIYRAFVWLLERLRLKAKVSQPSKSLDELRSGKGSLDEIDFSRHDEKDVPISCEVCMGPAVPRVGGFIFSLDDLRTCPKCKREGCKHWCDGKNPCEWCVDGVPEGFFAAEDDDDNEGDEWKGKP